jgi:multidrug efflux pump subunit AcrA (membrane-fusion protein)
MIKSAILLLALFLFAACASPANQPRQTALEDEPTPVPTSIIPSKPTYEVQRGEVIAQIEFSGRIAPVAESPLAFPLDGQVSNVYVQRNDLIDAGALIADLDTQELARQLALAQSALEVAQSRLAAVENQLATDRRRAEINVAMAQLNLDFARSQAGDTPTPDEDYQIRLKVLELELAQLALAEITDNIDPLLRSDVEQAELQVAELTAAIASAQLTAPVAGQIISLNLAPGQQVKAQDPVAIIGDVSQLEVSAVLRENLLSEMTENMSATIAVAGRPGQALAGTVRRLPYPYGSGNAESAGADETVRIAFDDPAVAGELALGDRVTVVVILTRHEDVLWLPPSAIRTFSGRQFVVIQAGEGQQRVDLKLGIAGEDRVEIEEGVAEGQIVIGP